VLPGASGVTYPSSITATSRRRYSLDPQKCLTSRAKVGSGARVPIPLAADAVSCPWGEPTFAQPPGKGQMRCQTAAGRGADRKQIVEEAADDLKHVCADSAGRYDSSMLQALRPEDALAIAEVSRRRSRDEQAMAQYLCIGRGARANGAPPDGTPLRLPGDVDLAAFESEERHRLEAAIARLSPDARRELIALTWLAQRPLLSFEAALRRTRRIPPAAQPGYLMGIRLERYIAEGLRRLGCGGA
jgi:hypothetical protein